MYSGDTTNLQIQTLNKIYLMLSLPTLCVLSGSGFGIGTMSGSGVGIGTDSGKGVGVGTISGSGVGIGIISGTGAGSGIGTGICMNRGQHGESLNCCSHSLQA